MDEQSPAHPPGASRWLGWVAAWAIRAIGATWRIRVVGADPFEATAPAPVLGALLHRDFLVAAWLFRDRGIHVGVSRSRDGDLIDAVLHELGYADSARGSSSRGGVAAQRELLGSLARGESVAVVVDGPRGPAGIPKPGVAQLAARAGVAIQPMSIEAGPVWRFGSWDAAQLPLPFARVECRYAEALAIAPDVAPEPALDALRVRLS